MSLVHHDRCKECQMTRVDSPICRFHNVFNLYQCLDCKRYHVCDGGRDCVIVYTRENLVCDLTGSCVLDNVQDVCAYGPSERRAPESFTDPAVSHSARESLKGDILRYFETVGAKSEAYSTVVKNGQLNGIVGGLIDATFNECLPVMSDGECGRDLAASIYVHIIISIYSTKTVYDNLLFKCTRNKKYDHIVKNIRARWMRMVSTGDPSRDGATASCI
ncbi:ORF31 [macacine gammaherpesvirus 12]|uniref:ORF31 n=1 Tax=macacine gammaherpesvirus 12 TaxID=2560571 RepID=A0A0B5D6F1_9GAMA|nr:ORF31 [Macaca nemestrina rhadinovirus 2]AJE29673.1 ORF31 [Macaca nemestrina rhadinovirus 2]